MFLLLGLVRCTAFGQVSVLGGHNDIGRTGANTQETILTPASVASGNFEKLVSITLNDVAGEVDTQPLYVPGVQLGGSTHNVVVVATSGDDVYALDADSGAELWHITLLDAAHGAAPDAINDPELQDACEINQNVVRIGVTGTPAIDQSTGTIYLVGRTWESNYAVQRIHALDITSGAEKFGAPTTIAATVPGTGYESVLGQVSFDPEQVVNRAGLLLLNGVVYAAFASFCESTIQGWHGWVVGYNASTMVQTGAWATTPDATGSGIWMSGAALAADVDPVNYPFGRMFVATGNGSFNAVPSYTTYRNFGDDIVRLDLTNGVVTPQDSFTVDDQATLATSDGDLGSGGVMILPDSVGSFAHPHLLVQSDKMGNIFLVDRDNMGGYSTTMNNVVQELPNALAGGFYGTAAFWNGSVYFWGAETPLEAFSVANGAISSAPTSVSSSVPGYPGSTVSISANGATAGIAWGLTGSEGKQASLQAFDATNVATQLYLSDTNITRDNPGKRSKFSVPTVANGKVYVDSYVGTGAVSIFGSMFTVSAQFAALPAAPGSSPMLNLSVASPPGSTFTGAVTLSATGLPAGVTASFSAPAVTLGQSPAGGPSLLTLTIPSSLALGTYSFQVVGSSNALQSVAALTLNVSNLSPVTVPSVVGSTQSAATSAITTVGLVLGTVTTASSTTVAAGNVISQNPVGGTSSYAGYIVNLLVSTGPPITVPNVVGNTQAAATNAIVAASLVVGTVKNVASGSVPAGNVISESPIAGTVVAAGSAVNLVVSLGGPTVVSLSPSSGMGMTQTFTGVYSDPVGTSDLNYIYFLFNSTLTGANACYVSYSPGTNLMYLYSNAGTAVLSPSITPGSATSVSNSQCTLNGTGSSVGTSGNNLTLNVALTFTSAFIGSKNVYMESQGKTLNSGWVKEGTWTAGTPGPPSVVSLTPSSGSGLSQTFALLYSDPAGISDLNYVYVLFNTSLTGSNACYVSYSPGTNLMYLYSNAGTAVLSPGVTPGSAASVSNGQCTLNGTGSSFSTSGNNLTLNVALTFSGTFTGLKNAYMEAQGKTQNSGWVKEGTWTPSTVGPPTVVSITPASGSGMTETFALVYSDPAGISDLSNVYLLFNTAISGANACYVSYNPGTNLMYLYSNAGTAVLSPSITPGSATSVSNSQCTLNGTGSSFSTSGNNLTLNVALTFSSTFLGSKNAYMEAQGKTQNSGWVQEGTWTPGTAGPPTVVSLTPNSGTGLTQTFALVYSDPAGISDLSNVYLLFNTTLIGSNACYVSYHPATNLMYLYTNAGTSVLSPAITPGSGASVSNSQCTLNGTGSSFSTSGTNLTLNVALTFSGTFTGSENVYTEAQGKTQNSGWVTEGTWAP